ncbi:WD repeat-containing protein 75 [Psilocybe cubensis]|uniref:WD repeat-containing protein 75 second beta-propeller domain-containing protein n=2 Tax=Psilocybe cubensis TaxID=181762 RepID=A0A8H7Y9Q4_PSICU|nr:WD repeat-containing protein 75 [Psilocybe cubensis]KAH9486491.1 WD repeat-containing protein 75 [Psilocybe cubensis]
MAASTLKSSNSDNVPVTQKDTHKPLNKGKGKENPSKATAAPVRAELWQGRGWDDDRPWNWASLTDPSSSRIPPIFTKDGSYFFSLVGSTIKIYSSTTGLVVSILSAPSSGEENSNTDVFTSAIINPHNVFQLITATLDGRIMIWDFVNATLLQVIDVGQSIHFMCAHKQFMGFVFVAASRQRKKSNVHDNNAVVLKISLKPSDHKNQPSAIIPVGKTRFPTGLSISPNGAWLVATAGHKVYVAKTDTITSGFTKYVSPEKLTCLAFHPSDEYFATGDEKGVIRLWYCLNDNLAVNIRDVEKRTQTRSFHWHAHAVSSVSFTNNGAYLLSGGEEAVLVIWQLETGRKEFIPRLGAPISTISISRPANGEEEYLLGLSDATYTFISSASLKITRSYSRIKIDPSVFHGPTSSSKLNIAPIAVQRLTSTLVLPSSHPSSLQMYSLSVSSLLSELEVSPSNRISRRDDKPIIPSTVEKTVISESGYWMATIDSRDGDPGFRSEVYLKLWSWDSKNETWILNTRIDRPHGIHKVTDISFSPNALADKAVYLTTTGKDGHIKVWKLFGHQKEAWISYATLDFRSETPGSISWSPDASLFAVSVGAHIALYDPVSRSLRQALTTPECVSIQSVHFVGVDGRFLLASGINVLVMWDLLRGQVAWQTLTPLAIDKIVPHPKESTFAVFHSPDQDGEDHRTKITLFHVSSKVPTTIRFVPFGLRNVVWASYQKQPGYNLVGITYSWRVVLIGDSRPVLKDGEITARAMNLEPQKQKKTIFQDIFGVSAFSNTTVEHAHTFTVQRKSSENEVFTDPAYTAPSLETFFSSLLKPYLVVRPAKESNIPDDHDEVVEEDVVMEDEREIPIAHTSRVPIPGEMDTFIKLFKTHCLREDMPLPSSKGIPTINGIHPKETNSDCLSEETLSTKSKPSQMPQNQHGHAVASPSHSSTPHSMGKKRKKVSN